MDVGITSRETGPIEGVGAYIGFPSSPLKEKLDADGAATFHDLLLSVFLPADVQPAQPGLRELVTANWPAELGSGWFLGFDRASNHRSIRIVYSEADATR